MIARFDGEKIVLPEQLRGAAPGDVLIVYPAREKEKSGISAGPSIWDVFGKAPSPRTADDIQSQVRSERESWDPQ